MSRFSADVVDAVLRHMNDDHGADSLVIVRAHGAPGAIWAAMTDLDDEAGIWRVGFASGEVELRIPWPVPVHERPDLRRAVVELHRRAVAGDDAIAEVAGALRRPAPTPAIPVGRHGMSDPFSVRLRQRTWSGHEDSRGAGFITELLDGTRGVADYTALVAQHLQIYRAIEETGDRLAHDPVVGPFLDPALDRVARLHADLRTLGTDPDDDDLAVLSPLPATEAYAARVRDCVDQPIAFLAHHFTRYLGDLSGGQIIGTHLRRRFGWQEDGVRFYSFPAIASPKRYKDRYRARLDEVAREWSPEQESLMIDEVLTAYRHNTEVFVALEEARVPA